MTELERLIHRIGWDSQIEPLSVQDVAERIEKSDWLAEHDAQVLEEAADALHGDYRDAELLRERAAEYRKGAGQ